MPTRKRSPFATKGAIRERKTARTVRVSVDPAKAGLGQVKPATKLSTHDFDARKWRSLSQAVRKSIASLVKERLKVVETESGIPKIQYKSVTIRVGQPDENEILLGSAPGVLDTWKLKTWRFKPAERQSGLDFPLPPKGTLKGLGLGGDPIPPKRGSRGRKG